ncbi:MAG TPA: 3-phosphoserine/phosphohydroxythreonine transaminase [Desulfobacteraceae bacterium]|nr:3-phosphoserine/phosphohydroxythreonine transaminase [Desulfobacteraceae bacterium]
MQHRIHNFNPGPAALPLPVLEEIQAELLDYKGSGMSILEMSHRSKWFEDILNGAVDRLRRLLWVPPDFDVLFIQGGASLQFCMIPMNFAPQGVPVDYIDTGTWSSKAIKEARMLGRDVRVIASSEDRGYCCIPSSFEVDEDACYVHFTSNNTIKGTQWTRFPSLGEIPLVSDMSSDFMSRPLDVRPFGAIYAGAQKNIGPSGTVVAIVRKDMLERTPDSIPSMLKYQTYVNHNSLYNTPSCFIIYTVGLVLKWIEETVGGLEAMDERNRRKAKVVYDVIDDSGFYRGTAEETSRSLMNATFRLPDENLEKRFVEEALAEGLGGLKGHRSVGGCRASLYNAVEIEAVQALAEFMKAFERKNG